MEHPSDLPAGVSPAAVAPGPGSSNGQGDGIGDTSAGGSRAFAFVAPPSSSNQNQSKKKKKRNKRDENTIWTRPAPRKPKKKTSQAGGAAGASGSGAGSGAHHFTFTPPPNVCFEPGSVLVPAAARLAAERADDAPDQPVLLSRLYRSEKIEVSDDRLAAGSTKGYRMVRATRGVAAGAWYFEVRVVHLGTTGHTRLGWATDRADLQLPVGCDAYGFGYRDVDGAKVHKAWRDKYGDQGYGEGDVVGFYISLPDGEQFEPEQPTLIEYKGKPFFVQASKEKLKTPPTAVPGSEIRYFKNGVSQGSAFKDIPGGRYYPAASMYTLPDQPNCVVKFNFGPDFEFFPQDFEGLPIPQPMSQVPYQTYQVKNEGPGENDIAEIKKLAIA
ncbi:hypothetical protein U9M48_039073 [Paspalum notatum var. saurae]|uniref:B30.2/SPRY domain-containing protein n=1 Tax=Paspalum notatum var. saurae TaxID=547442 RepID=A0AAQ3XBQ1_PASNO